MKAEAWSAQRTVYADANGFTIPKWDAVNCTYDWKKNGKNHGPVTGAATELKFGVI